MPAFAGMTEGVIQCDRKLLYHFCVIARESGQSSKRRRLELLPLRHRNGVLPAFAGMTERVVRSDPKLLYRTRRFALTQAGPEHEALATVPGALYPPVRNGAPPRHV
jgi:hypothetical protein